MSFQLTTKAILNRTKTVTRRLGWSFLKPGDLIQACEKCMGLKKGEPLVKLAVIRIVNIKEVRLWDIPESDVVLEGFKMTTNEFVMMFMEHMNCDPDTIVNRIEFEYVD